VSDRVRLQARVHGRVQGVWFRESTRQAADRIGGLTGYVCNVPDGTVDVVAEGPREECELLLRWCGQGPRMARVERVDHEWGEPLLRPGAFEVTSWP
jgi:acylphosphatase